MKKILLLILIAGSIINAYSETGRIIRIGTIGIGDGAVQSLKQAEEDLPVEIVSLPSSVFKQNVLPDLSKFDIILAGFGNKNLKEKYAELFQNGAEQPCLYAVGPPHLYKIWCDWIGKEHVKSDPKMAAYYGLSEKSMQDMVKYILRNQFSFKDLKVDPPDSSNLSNFFHPAYENILSIDDFFTKVKKSRTDAGTLPRVAIGSFRHHINFHQPKVIRTLIEQFDAAGILTLCIVADSKDFQKNLTEFKPDLVIMTSHTREPATFWEKLNVPRIHALWFMDESIKEWKESNNSGMMKSEMQHLLISAELRGATECLTSGGTKSGGNCGEEILPISDRIERIVARSKSWINLRKKENKDKKVSVVIYDHQANKANLMCGAHHALNAPKSMIKFLNALQKEGYVLEGEIPKDEDELLKCINEYGRQMGSWEPENLNRIASSGKAVLIPATTYLKWFREKVPVKQQQQMQKHWGEAPGKYMVWEKNGEKCIVLPKIDFGHIVLMTQPPKGEALSANIKFTPDESMMPPTHNFLATYFWMQEEFKADAVIHFGSHGNEWLFPGKQAVMSKGDWSDMMLGNIPNINPWLSTNTAELVPCKRRARAVAVDFLPPALMYADLSHELQNLDSTIDKYKTLDDSALRNKFAVSITKMVKDNQLDRELEFESPEQLNEKDVDKVSLYLHDLKNEMIPANMHILGERIPDELLIPYLTNCIGDEYTDALRPFYKNEQELNVVFEQIIDGLINQQLTLSEAVRVNGGVIPNDIALKKLQEYIDVALEINRNLDLSYQEISNIFKALDGEFVPPGPSGAPERNPAVVPTGRNLYVLNPSELPTKSSWELGTKLMEDYLNEIKVQKGEYPKKIAFSLVPYATYNDFGIIESQILYLMGVKPVWNFKNQVSGIELIPTSELKRPRIDVFLNARNVYQDELPQMMKLLDKAVKLAASVDEPDNYIYQHSRTVQSQLKRKGFTTHDAKTLSTARMFGTNPNENIDGHDWFFYLTERTGEWDSRDQILDVYMEHSKYVYTEGMWGVKAPQAYDLTIQDTEHIMRSWYDNRDFVLGNKFAWWAQGTLSMAIKRLTGKEPEYLFVDVRNPKKASIVDSTLVVQKDFRARLTNPKWIRQMMKEGYAGASQISRTANNMLGWEITRKHTIKDSNWNELTDVYIRDKHQLNLREWFNEKNPYAFQKVAVTLLETARKGYWQADQKTIKEIAEAYAESVAKYGSEQGIHSGGNKKLEKFVGDQLPAEVAEAYENALDKENEISKPSETVEGQKMTKVEHQTEEPKIESDYDQLTLLAGLILLITTGFFFKRSSFAKEND